jgi:hypothetical protein
MAINIYREPNETSTPYLPVYFDVSSDEATVVSMIADVYVDSTLVSTIDKDPIIGTTNTFRFEVGEILKKHFTKDVATSGLTDGLRQSSGSALNYHIRAFEVLDNGTTLDTSWTESGTGTNYAQSTTAYAFDGIMHYGQDLDNYICNNDETDLLLTNRPFATTSTQKDYETSKLLDNVPFEIGFLAEQDIQFRVTQYDVDFNILLDSTYSTITPTNNKALIQQDGNYLSNIKYLRFRLWDNASNPISLAYIFKVVEACGNETVVRWKNQYGGYDYYFFEGNSKKKSKSRQKTYTQRLSYDYIVGDRGETVRTSDNKEEFEIYTGTENYRTIDWLHEIFESTDVAILTSTVKTDNEYTPIIVTGGSTRSLDDERPVTQFSLKYRLANPKESQVG